MKNTLLIFKTSAALLLLAISLFSYSRETHRKTANGSSVESFTFDGAEVATLILGIAVVVYVRKLNKDIKRLSIRFGLPPTLPKVTYEALPLLFLPFLLYDTGRSGTNSIVNGSVTITSGWGISAFKWLVLATLMILIFLVKLRKRVNRVAELAN